MVKIGIVIFPGTNCELDVFHVLTDLFNEDVRFIWHTKDKLGTLDALIIPGGFAFGDRLRAGVIAAHSPIIGDVKRLARDGTPILGICNGFQILLECGLLPGALIVNKPADFLCKWVTLEVLNNETPFTNKFKINKKVYFPIAHGEGRYVADHQTMHELQKKNRIVLKYSGYNPNGSFSSIAGICNDKGNILGIMPHPERASEKILVPGKKKNDGLLIFESLLSHIEKSKPILKMGAS
jgi:phosphoribosylformylglycinamidine synthase subunit PurQ / glutaminase